MAAVVVVIIIVVVDVAERVSTVIDFAEYLSNSGGPMRKD